jgi:hypothetical protein
MANDIRFNDYLLCFSLEKWGRTGKVAPTGQFELIDKQPLDSNLENDQYLAGQRFGSKRFICELL